MGRKTRAIQLCDGIFVKMEKVSHESRRPIVPEHHILTMEMQLSSSFLTVPSRPYVNDIPPIRPSNRFLVSSPARKPSFYDVTKEVILPTQKQAPKRKQKVLRCLLYEQYLSDIMHRVQRSTYSYKVKRAPLLQPREFYTCCPIRYNTS